MADDLCLSPFSSFNISETKHDKENLTTNILVFSKVVIDKPI